METTSHFLGVTLKKEVFSDLINSLWEYQKENMIQEIIEIQDLDSLHITLYYLGRKLDLRTLEKIKEDLVELNKIENLFPIYIDKMGYFKTEKQNNLAYLYPSDGVKLENINLELKGKYVNEIIDNNYPTYIPHMTLFKINKLKQYTKHSKNIELIVNSELKKICKINVFEKINLYMVDSNFSPEKQTVVF
jgi:2'-5' RNA ligase